METVAFFGAGVMDGSMESKNGTVPYDADSGIQALFLLCTTGRS